MILVLLGTFHIEFTRPLLHIDQLIIRGIITEEVIVQNGHTKFESENLVLYPFLEYQEIEELYDRARLVITHAGTGSILKGVKKKKKVIAIPRLKKNGEHIDDHQLEILEEFEKMGYILAWNEGDLLENILNKASHFEPKPYISKKEKIVNYLKSYIDSL